MGSSPKEKISSNNQVTPKQRSQRPNTLKLTLSESERLSDQVAIQRAKHTPHLLLPQNVARLQRIVGNRTMSRIVTGRTSALTPTIQLVHSQKRKKVAKVKKYKNGAWYSEYDPFTTFLTKKEATVYHRKLGKESRQKIKGRVPTLYTYTHKKPTNKLSNVPQGPHTIAFKVILLALQKAKTKKDLFKIFDKQVPEPNDVDKIMKTESPSKGYNKQIQPRIKRYTKDYRETFTKTKSQFSQKNPDLIYLKHRVNRLLNLHPYATYNWKTTRKSSKKSLKGKGEGKKNPSYLDLVDKPTKSFNDQDTFNSFVETREELFKF
jgi:hypothetical protein